MGQSQPWQASQMSKSTKIQQEKDVRKKNQQNIHDEDVGQKTSKKKKKKQTTRKADNAQHCVPPGFLRDLIETNKKVSRHSLMARGDERLSKRENKKKE